MNAPSNACSQSCRPLFQEICQKYDDLTQVYKLSAVSKKIDTVKIAMQENVKIALDNTVKMEQIEVASEELQRQAGVFKNNTNELRNKMRWKNIKVNIIS